MAREPVSQLSPQAPLEKEIKDKSSAPVFSFEPFRTAYTVALLELISSRERNKLSRVGGLDHAVSTWSTLEIVPSYSLELRGSWSGLSKSPVS